MSIETGKFVVFEGGEGAGKTVQSVILANWLAERGYEVVRTREPGGTKGAEIIRNLLMDRSINQHPKFALCLFLAARRLHLDLVIRPARESGKIVICDRFKGSTFVYQSFAGGLDYETVRQINDFVTDGYEPDVTILFDLDPKIGLDRKFSNPGLEITPYDLQTLDYHEKLRLGYLQLAKMSPNWEVIDAGRSVEEVKDTLIGILVKKNIIGTIPPEI